MKKKLILFPSLFVALFLNVSVTACDRVGCEYANVDVVPSRDLKHVAITASRICGQGMATTSDDVMLLTPSSEFNIENLNAEDWVMIFSSLYAGKPKPVWASNSEIQVILPSSDISPGYPQPPREMRKLLHGVKIKISERK
jgi:hypothetical protein